MFTNIAVLVLTNILFSRKVNKYVIKIIYIFVTMILRKVFMLCTEVSKFLLITKKNIKRKRKSHGKFKCPVDESLFHCLVPTAVTARGLFGFGRALRGIESRGLRQKSPRRGVTWVGPLCGR